jgi:hypothetical protein
MPSISNTEALLILEEGDNSPLPLTSASLQLPSYRLRFFRPAETDLVLYYGNNNLEVPRYDLDLLSYDLLEATAEEIEFGPQDTSVPTQPAGNSTPAFVFWCVLGVAVLILVALIARLVKKAAG